jgi:2,3-diketo-5-methylthio-1-phosphopentane phosphatase
MTGIQETTIRLIDIEGTASPYPFVGEVMVPFAKERIPLLLNAPDEIAGLVSNLQLLREEYEQDLSAHNLPYSPLDYITALMNEDRKSTALKRIQGIVWNNLFDTGQLVSQLFEDVPPALERWGAERLRTFVYSSGDADTQRRFFKFSNLGDQTQHIEGFFDTTIGAKTDPASYLRIAEKIGVDPNQILFVTDAPKELIPSDSVGYVVRFANRAGNVFSNENNFPAISSFDEI